MLRGYFNGKNKISITAYSQAIEQIAKTVLAIIIVGIMAGISNNNTIIMVSLAASSTTISAFISFIYLYLCYLKSKKEIWMDVVTSKFKQTESVSYIIRKILFISFPITFTAILASSNKTIDAFTIVNIVSKFYGTEKAKLEYGILTGKVEGLIMLPYSFNIAFATTLIPTIAASQARNEMSRATQRIEFSILATILITLPCAAILFVFPSQILKLLFPNAYLGAEMLRICSVSIIFVATTQTIGGVLHGLRKVKEPLIAIGIGSIVKLVMNLALLPIDNLNIYGAIIASLLSHIIIFSINYHYLIEYTHFKINIIKFMIKPIIATLAMINSSIILNKMEIFTSQNINLLIALVFGLLIYVISIFFLNIVSKEEIFKFRQKKYDYKDSRIKTF